VAKRNAVAIGSLAGALCLIGLVVWSLTASSPRHFQVNDDGTGIESYIPNPIRHEVKEGYLTFFRQAEMTGPGLERQIYYEFRLYGGPATSDAFWEIWGDSRQSNESRVDRSTRHIYGPKIRLDLQTRRLSLLTADKRFILRNLGPVKP
jgi:hypothetical protein